MENKNIEKISSDLLDRKLDDIPITVKMSTRANGDVPKDDKTTGTFTAVYDISLNDVLTKATNSFKIDWQRSARSKGQKFLDTNPIVKVRISALSTVISEAKAIATITEQTAGKTDTEKAEYLLKQGLITEDMFNQLMNV